MQSQGSGGAGASVAHMSRSSCRGTKAAFEREAVAKLEHAVFQVDSGIWLDDDFVAERSLVPSAAATGFSQPIWLGK